MKDKIYPSQVADRLFVRVPEGMRGELLDAARQNGRSMTAEIVSRLERSLRVAPTAASSEEIERRLAALERAIFPRAEGGF